MPRVADVSRPTLSETGPIYVTQAAARQFLAVRGYQDHEIETARRELTELLLDAKQQPSVAHMWRARKRSTKLDITAIVKQEGRLLVVTFISVQPYDPPSRTAGNRPRSRSRFPAGPQSGARASGHVSGEPHPGTSARRRGSRAS